MIHANSLKYVVDSIIEHAVYNHAIVLKRLGMTQAEFETIAEAPTAAFVRRFAAVTHTDMRTVTQRGRVEVMVTFLRRRKDISAVLCEAA